MKLSKKLIPVVVVVVVLGVVGAWLLRWVKTDASQTIALSGYIELTEVNIAFKVPGKLEERTVDEGAQVKKGMVIARLDQDPAQELKVNMPADAEILLEDKVER